MLFFGPPNVEKMEQKRDVAGLIKALRYKAGSSAPEHLHLRGRAAMALGQIGETRAVEPLLAVLRDDNSDVRGSAAAALGKIGDARAVEPLVAALRSNSLNVRSKATDALVKIGSPAVEPLTAALRDDDSNVRWIAAETLWKIGDQLAVDPLVAALRDDDSDVRWIAAEALGKIGDQRVVEPLVAALRDGSMRVRKGAASALDALSWRPGLDASGAWYWVLKERWDRCVEIGSLAVEPLVAALRDNTPDVRKRAAKALGQICDARAVEPLVTALRDGDKGVGKGAANALNALGWRPGLDASGAWYWVLKEHWDRCVEIGSPAVEPLGAALRDNTPDVRDRAAEALVKIGSPAVEPLVAALRDNDWDVRSRAAKALGMIGDHRAVEPLIAALRHDRNVGAAAEALGKMGSPAVKPLIAALSDLDWNVRWGAAKALVGMFRRGNMDNRAKREIVVMRGTIVKAHTDYYDYNVCAGFWPPHGDSGIGVEF
ncbi:MAG: hypothetical protein EPO21_09935 [Chloroflexota bacterium]|nr:MAG: hypothetical protein EPO21_09935 [Chloroflexota bacterium]